MRAERIGELTCASSYERRRKEQIHPVMSVSVGSLGMKSRRKT